METYGIRGIVNQWFKSYLCNRKECVEINYMENISRISERYKSTVKEMKGGVPQGSVLGPVLFLLYKNDLPINTQRGRTTLFADDINTQIEATNITLLHDIIKEVMQQVASWFRLNKLVINPDKTTAISSHAWQNKNNPTPEIIFQDMIIKYKSETKF